LILVVLGDSTSTIGLDVRQMLVVGRSDPGAEEKPDLDLARHRAMEHGISRHHAALIPTHDALYLTDLDSTNGTWINGEFLQPGDRYPLKTGDELEFGLLRLMVKTVSPFQRSPS
jgi:pSer/pThr/pTyr-binding forkhead associated (FHA) protein